jgi:hypothetical protein
MVTDHFAAMSTFAGLITWLHKYMRDKRDFEVDKMVLFSSLPPGEPSYGKRNVRI